MSSPKIALVGFGMAGVGASRALRHHRGLADTPATLRPEVVVFEANDRVGGKVAPRNVGAQFIDREHFYPIDRLVEEHGLRTHPAREDYELVRMRLASGATLDPEDFEASLATMRRELLAELTPERAAALDAVGVAQYVERLGARGLLDADGMAAMRARALLEEGKRDVSALYYALTFAKSRTPMERREMVGGLHALPLAERRALERDGGRVVLGARVIAVELKRGRVRITWQSAEDQTELADFDAAILCLSPEQLGPKRLRVTGSPLPIAAHARLRPARITKSCLTLHKPVRASEHATERYAMWLSPPEERHELVATFFHGWEGQQALSLWQMLRVAVGRPDPSRLVAFESRTWDTHGALPEAYITQPGAGEARALIQLARDQYFKDRYAGSPLRLANHTLGIGGTIRDAAMAGERAVLSLLSGWGYDTRPAWRHFEDPERAFFGVGAEVLDAL